MKTFIMDERVSKILHLEMSQVALYLKEIFLELWFMMILSLALLLILEWLCWINKYAAISPRTMPESMLKWEVPIKVWDRSQRRKNRVLGVIPELGISRLGKGSLKKQKKCGFIHI